jgi:hypothetical protein
MVTGLFSSRRPISTYLRQAAINIPATSQAVQWHQSWEESDTRSFAREDLALFNAGRLGKELLSLRKEGKLCRPELQRKPVGGSWLLKYHRLCGSQEVFDFPYLYLSGVQNPQRCERIH